MRKCSDRCFDLFPTPLWQGQIDNVELIEAAKRLAYEFRENVGRAALVSDGWDKRELSGDRADFDRKGVTSFASGNLATEPGWYGVAHALHHYSRELLSDRWEIDTIDIANMWVTIYPAGAYVPEHTHAKADVSGVFYVKAAGDCGDLVFRDPSWVAKTACNNGESTFPIEGTRQRFKPSTGDLLLFPSWLPHYTEPNNTKEDRIIISFNLLFPQPPRRIA